MAEAGDTVGRATSALGALIDPPERADAGLFVIHGAGEHAPSSTLHDLLNPTFSRMREEGNIISIRPFQIPGHGVPGGDMNGLLVEFVPDGQPLGPNHRPAEAPTADDVAKAASRAQRLMVVEARWNDVFLKTRPRDVSFWAALHVGRMMWEVLLYHYRSPLAAFVALGSLGMIIAGFWFDDVPRSFGFTVGGMALAFSGGLFDAFVPWSAREEGLAAGSDGRHAHPLYMLASAASSSVQHIQRGLVIVAAAMIMVVLPAVSLIFRCIATLPGLDGVSRGTLATIERILVGGAASDVETISNNPSAASVIQSRLRAGLIEIEQRLPAGATLTVLAHSAGGPLGYWLLSEPAIHQRQAEGARNAGATDANGGRLRYRLITVGAALNWAKRGMDTIATPLHWPLVNAVHTPTRWMNMYAVWDPTPHGPVREHEYAPGWAAWPQTRGPAPRLERSRSARERALRALRRAWAWGCPGPKLNPLNNPNLAMRNLGSPVSAEHSEYFRNQQEFVPALVRSIDEEISWAAAATSPQRHRQWTNVRTPLLSSLTRFRMFMLALPVGTLIANLTNNNILTSLDCASGTDNRCDAMLDRDIESPPGVWFMDDWTRGIREFMRDDLPWNGFMDANIWIEDIMVVGIMVLVMYALVDLYTNAFWAVLGRRVRSLGADDGARWWPPSRWSLGGLPLVSAVVVWLPTLIPPLFLFALNAGTGWWVIVGVNTTLAAVEAYWFGRGMRAVRAEPEMYPEFLIGSQRHSPYLV